MLVQQDIQRLLVNPRVRELDLRVLLVGRVHDRVAADLRDLAPVTVERPAADLAGADHVLNKQYSTTESKRQFVEQFYVF